ncbi:2580_t:CDS:2, partial [Gigaspora margarita]
IQTSIFNHYIEHLDNQIGLAGQSILLILDGASTHRLQENFARQLFKAHYNKLVCEDCIDAFDAYLEFGSNSPEPITIMTLPLPSGKDAEEYVIADNNLIITEMPNDEEIIEAIKNHECIEPEDEVSNKLISSAQALGFIDGILSFLEQQPDSSFNIDVSLIRNLGKLKKRYEIEAYYFTMSSHFRFIYLGAN